MNFNPFIIVYNRQSILSGRETIMNIRRICPYFLSLCIGVWAVPHARGQDVSELANSTDANATALLQAFAMGGECAGANTPQTLAVPYAKFVISLTAFESRVMTASFPIDLSALASMRLQVADAALKSKCPGLADAQYRAVVSRYVGNSYQAFRERAKIGIDDVRALSASQTTKDQR